MIFERLIVQPLLPPAAVLLIGAAGVGASLWLYRRPSVAGGSSGGSAWHVTIALVRAAGVLAVVAALLRPSVVRPKSVEEYGPLVVLVDVSRSMGVRDNGRSVGQRVELADALGLLPPGLRQDHTADFRVGVEGLSVLLESAALAGSELDYARLAARSPEAAQSNFDRQTRALADGADRLAARTARGGADRRLAGPLAEIARLSREPNSNWYRAVRDRLTQVSATLSDRQSEVDQRLVASSPQARAASDAVAEMTRLELADRLLTGPGGLLDAIGPHMPVTAFAIGDGVVPLDLRTDRSAGVELKTLFDRSNLTSGLAEARGRLGDAPRAAIVMLSDGRQVGAEGDVATALGKAQTPVFTVACAGPIKRDVVISRVVAPPRAIAGEMLPVRVEIAAIGDRIDSTPVTVELAGRRVWKSVSLRDGRGSATFAIEAGGGGIERLEVSAPVTSDEASPENNRTERPIKISRRRLKVAVLGYSGDKEFAHVRDILSRLPWVELTDRPRAPASATATAPATAPASSASTPLGPDELVRQDVTIVIDVSATSLDDAGWLALRRATAERGVAVILAAGEGVAGARSAEQIAYRSFLPFSTPVPAWRVWPGDEPAFRFAPAGDGAEAAPVLADEIDPQQTARLWNAMAPVSRYLPLSDLVPGVRPILAERDSGTAIFTEARFGAGRVYFLGVGETWRWASKKGDREIDPFWPRLIRNAAEPFYAEGGGGFALDVEPLVVAAGKPVSVRARREPAVSGAAPARIDVMRSGRVTSVVELSPAAWSSVESTRGGSASPFHSETTFNAPEPGDYVVRLRTSTGGDALTVPFTVESTRADELRNLNGDAGLLRRIAESSGGELLRLEQARSLPAKIAAARERQPQYIEYRLWDSPYLFIFVVACFGVEWSLRKRIGLA